jgi:hypothetical protein
VVGIFSSAREVKAHGRDELRLLDAPILILLADAYLIDLEYTYEVAVNDEVDPIFAFS